MEAAEAQWAVREKGVVRGDAGATRAADEVLGERVGEVVAVVWVACAAEVGRALPTNWPSAAARRAKSCA